MHRIELSEFNRSGAVLLKWKSALQIIFKRNGDSIIMIWRSYWHIEDPDVRATSAGSSTNLQETKSTSLQSRDSQFPCYGQNYLPQNCICTDLSHTTNSNHISTCKIRPFRMNNLITTQDAIGEKLMYCRIMNNYCHSFQRFVEKSFWNTKPCPVHKYFCRLNTPITFIL